MLVTQQGVAIKSSTITFVGNNLEQMKRLAQTKAKEIRSYIFEVFEEEKKKGLIRKKILVGYAVPR